MDFFRNICFFWKRKNEPPAVGKLEKCKNYDFCQQENPEWELRELNGYCYNCATVVGPLKLKNSFGECPICNHEKDLAEIFCGKHELCTECWIKIVERDSSCPMCRKHLFEV